MYDGTEAQALKALIDWQAELGADLPLGDAPIDRYAIAPVVPAKAQAQTASKAAQDPVPLAQEGPDPKVEAQRLAANATDLASLRAAMESFGHCDLQLGASQLVFADGLAGARVMILGEAPGRDEDLQGKPFMGRNGQLLDKMLAAIGLDRRSDEKANGVYLSNILPWRPPQNRHPTDEEIAMLAPFAKRHIELAAPEIIVLMGNAPCQGLLGRKGITRLRGNWENVADRPCLPMFHPNYLLRNTLAKREAWADLLALKARLS